ncbi:MAG: hypothetical protein ACI8SE_001263 [Bacteroidia bacterium]|jgi:hypothetical protein
MKQLFSVLFVFFGSISVGFSQNYVDAEFQIKTETDISYGSSADVAGNRRNLTMNMSYPTNDSVKSCGRPLMIIIHGGAFMAGDKADGSLTILREEFAKRGYVTASVNYRLGVLHTDRSINCNVSSFGASWNCLNVTDSSEWYRANYRGVQDVHGAIRYLVNDRNSFKINANNVFVVGESAGGFTALGVGFIDDASEVRTDLTGSLSPVNPPSKIYENDCIIGRGLDTNTASMRLTRPDLGSYRGGLNPPIQNNYTIRGVGNFYGGIFDDIVESHSTITPVLYAYHQPNDLVVPFGYSRVYAGFNTCAMSFPFNCQGIINRPLIYGSKGIINLIDSAKVRGKKVPEYLFEPTNNTANCAIQIANPSTAGHGFDNFKLRRTNMAKYFATAINTCQVNEVQSIENQLDFTISPNPPQADEDLHVYGYLDRGSTIEIVDLKGKILASTALENYQYDTVVRLNKLNESGIFIVRVTTGQISTSKRIIVL